MFYVEKMATMPELIKESFIRLKRDPNMEKGDDYRYRAFSVGNIFAGEISVSEHSEVFHQSKKLNKYKGGIDRYFPLIEMDVARFVAKHIILPHVYSKIPQNDYHFGIHQIRIRATDVMTGLPAPEGIHQDGFNYVAVNCVDFHNVTGGNSLLVKADQYDDVLFNQILTPNEMIIFDDKLYAHYASPIVPLLPGEGYRDVFVTTLQEVKAP